MASTSPSSLSPPEIPMELHITNREKLLNSLRRQLTESSRPLHGFVLLQGGEEQNRYCTDHLELFRRVTLLICLVFGSLVSMEQFMLKTLERYQKSSYGAVEAVNKPAKELESSYREYLRLKGRYEALQRTQRNLLGEDLGPLNSKELEQLERQLESSLKHVRSIKTQFMLDQLSDLQNKEHMLLEANRSLSIKDIATGNSILFAPRLPEDYAVWMGKIKPTTYFEERYKVNTVHYTDEIVQALLDKYKGSGKPLLFLLHGLNTDSNNFSKPAAFEGMEKFETDLTTLHPILTECRVLKSDPELALIQFANDISSEAHVELNSLSPAEFNKSCISFLDSSTKSKSKLSPGIGLLSLKKKNAHIRNLLQCCSSVESPPPPSAWPGRAFPDPDRRKDADGPKPISILGSTGSIGTQTLDIVAENPDKFKVVALAAGSNVALLAHQVKKFKPQLVAIRNESLLAELKEALADLQEKPEIIPGEQGIIEVARHPDAVTVVTGIVGCAGLKPTVAAIEAGKDIALANKETLIAGGPFILPLAHKHKIKILPADSEHSAIFQCIQGLPDGALRRIILTASGGAFRDWPVEKLKDVKVADALKHPNWSMGKKITVDLCLC